MRSKVRGFDGTVWYGVQKYVKPAGWLVRIAVL
jgi:hypothetical protein